MKGRSIQNRSLKITIINNGAHIGVRIPKEIHKRSDLKSKSRKISRGEIIHITISIIDINDIEDESNLAMDMYEDPINRGMHSRAIFRKNICVPIRQEIGFINS